MKYIVNWNPDSTRNIFRHDNRDYIFYLKRQSTKLVTLPGKLLVNSKNRLDFINVMTCVNLVEKQTLEQQVPRPACSNAFSQNQPIQQHGGAIT
jgi:hypothetical protein